MKLKEPINHPSPFSSDNFLCVSRNALGRLMSFSANLLTLVG